MRICDVLLNFFVSVYIYTVKANLKSLIIVFSFLHKFTMIMWQRLKSCSTVLVYKLYSKKIQIAFLNNRIYQLYIKRGMT